ncbi:iron-sulfur cluster biosynthesis family protein [Clostridium sp. CCUG 7971]|uniref:iron-sulfur cluster biosynthesis family protein n=1 Tax=Clostridium sp. CCUG 7971 TaxID=2811414 RepID=UPI001ABA05BA|nr:iron-sulfur cluster biosynthesis family protein [Clostridium sp. CCUG 7971]MBO3445556.1 Fe-S cluster assembly protein HesB [Clostridium sp. CCUG 7971]
MKITLPETAINTLKDILKDNQGKPTGIRVYFAGNGCSGPSFGIALDEQKADDLEYDIEGLHFIMSNEDYTTYGDIVIEDTGYGFMIRAENIQPGGGCGGGCSGCGH